MGKIKVLLAHPEESRTKYDFKGIIENECLELEYVSAVLDRSKAEVFFWDGKIENESFKSRLISIEPDVVCIFGRVFQENFILEYLEISKAHNSKIITIAGGLHAQLSYERLYKGYVDYIVKSFDPFRIPEILEAHLRGNEAAFEAMPDICYRKDGRFISNESQPFDIKRLPRPDRSYFYAHANNYNYLDMKHAAWVRTAYSCPYRCNFCLRNRMNCNTYSARNIEDVVDEIAEINCENIYIVDDDFLYDEERVRTFISLVKLKGIKKKYICYGRSNFIAANEKIMEELASIGFVYILVGLEAVDDSFLQSYNKRSDMDNNEKTVAICKRYGLKLMGMFILDMNYRTADFRKLYRWIKERDLKNVAISMFVPEMGLEASKEYEEELLTDNPSHYDYLHLVCKPKQMSARRYYWHYYLLMIRLFAKAWRDGVYDFLDYGDYIRSFIRNIFVKRKNDDE